MGIDLGGGEVGMAEHDLHTAQVGAVFQQMGGKGVPEGMGRDTLADTGQIGPFFDDVPEGLTTHGVPQAGEKEELVVTGGIEPVAAPLQVGVDPLTGRFTDRHQPLLVPLAQGHQIADRQVDLAQLEPDQLRDPQTGGIEQLQHGQVADILARAAGTGRKKGIHLLGGEEFRQLVQGAGGLDDRSRVDIGVVLDHQELVEHADSRQAARPAARADALFLEHPQEEGDISRADAGRCSAPLLLKVIEIAGQVAAVGLLGVTGKPLFHRQVADEEIQVIVHTCVTRVP